MEQYFFNHCDFSIRFKQIRHEYTQCLGNHILLRDHKTKAKAIAQIYSYNTESEYLQILNQVIKGKLIDNESQLKCRKFYCKFLGYTFKENSNTYVNSHEQCQSARELYLIFEYHSSNLQQQLKNKEIAEKKIKKVQNEYFIQKDLYLFLLTMAQYLYFLENLNEHYLCMNSQEILIAGLDTIQCSFKILYNWERQVQPDKNGVTRVKNILVNYICKMNGNNQSYDAQMYQRRYGAQAVNFSLMIDDISNLFLSRQQLKMLQGQRSQSLSFFEKITSDKQALGLMILKMITPYKLGRVIKFEQFKVPANKLEQKVAIQNCMEREKYLVNSQKYLLEIIQALSKQNILPRQLLKIVQFLLFDDQMQSFNQLKSMILESNKQKPHFRSPQLHYSRRSNYSSKKSKQTHEKQRDHSSSRQIKNLPNISPFQLGSKSRFNVILFTQENNNKTASSKKKQKILSIQQIEDKILLNPQNRYLPYENIKQKIYSDGSKYIGQLMIINNEQLQHGRGIYYYPQGDIYGGDWQYNRLKGYGLYLFANGQMYQGGVFQGMRHGYGVYTYTNGNRYYGEWLNNSKHGFGTYQYNHRGDIYEGNFEVGKKSGKGVYKWKNGSVYKGSFNNDVKQGLGTGIYPDGSQIIGTWCSDQLEGQVQINFINGQFYKGQFKRQNLNGHGFYNYNDGSKYQGNFMEGKKHGKGQLYFQNGDQYKGDFHNDKIDGFGIYFYKNQSSAYEGYWKQNFQQGKGKVILPNQTIIQLVYIKGLPSKHGKIYYPNGDRYQGEVTCMARNGKGVYFFQNGHKIQGNWVNGAFYSMN